MSQQKSFRTPDRVKTYGEVFTPATIVQKMCDRVERLASDPVRRVLDPSCGTGSFLSEILCRRLTKLSSSQSLTPPRLLLALSTLYGVDILPDNVIVTRQSLRAAIERILIPDVLDYRFWPLVDMFLLQNILCADFLHHQNELVFTDWQQVSDYNFTATPQALTLILQQVSSSSAEIKSSK